MSLRKMHLNVGEIFEPESFEGYPTNLKFRYLGFMLVQKGEFRLNDGAYQDRGKLRVLVESIENCQLKSHKVEEVRLEEEIMQEIECIEI